MIVLSLKEAHFLRRVLLAFFGFNSRVPCSVSCLAVPYPSLSISTGSFAGMSAASVFSVVVWVV